MSELGAKPKVLMVSVVCCFFVWVLGTPLLENKTVCEFLSFLFFWLLSFLACCFCVFCFLVSWFLGSWFIGLKVSWFLVPKFQKRP